MLASTVGELTAVDVLDDDPLRIPEKSRLFLSGEMGSRGG